MAATIDEDQVWQDTGGKPIVNGSIFIGIQNQDPVLNPITIFSDRDLTVAIANPQITDSFGRSTNKIWIPGRYSITIQDSDSVQKYSELDVGEAAQTGISNLTNIQGVDTIAADGNPTITTLVDQELFTFTAIGTITGAVTLQIDSTPTQSVLKYHDQPLVAGDWELDQVILVMNNEADGVYELISNTAAHNFAAVDVSGITTLNGTVYTKKGADIASANDTVLLADGNYNDITGTTTINGMTDGVLNETRKFQYDAAVLLKHNTAASSGFSSLFLTGESDYTTIANDEIEFTYDGTLWRVSGGVDLIRSELQTEIATTSGTTHDFTSIPPWVKTITIMLFGVSTDGTDNLQIKLGDSGGFESSGYLSAISELLSSSVTTVNSTTAFPLSVSHEATDIVHGAVILNLEDSANDTWICAGNIITSDGARALVMAGSKTLSTTLTQIRLTTTSGTDVFDAGAINIIWE